MPLPNPWDPSDDPGVPTQTNVAPTITFDEVDVTDNQSTIQGLPPESGVWSDYVVVNQYENDGHVYMAGVTSPGPLPLGAAFFQLAAPTLLWVASWTAFRLGAKPKIPDPNGVDTNWVLLDRHVDAYIAHVGPDGVTPRYRISGVYVYGALNPDPALLANLAFPKPPWLNDGDKLNRTLDGSDYDNTILVPDPGTLYRGPGTGGPAPPPLFRGPGTGGPPPAPGG